MTGLLFFALLAAAAEPPKPKPVHELCPRVRFLGVEPKLTEVEKRLVCGDPETDSWKKVSLPEARHFMRAFLQDRGYHFPRFTADDDVLTVDIGTSTVVRKLTSQGFEGIYDTGKRRKIVGQALTPELLDKTKKAMAFELQSRGYPCPDVTVTADARSGQVQVDAEPGDVLLVRSVTAAKVEGLDPAVFNRFRAFEYDVPLDIRLLSLTSDRIKRDALFMSAYYDVVCSSSGVDVVQHVVQAPPHLVTIGVGFDTEGYAIGKARYQESRIGYRASSFEANAYVSEKRQSLDSTFRYYLRPADRVHLMPSAFVRRENELPYEAVHSQGFVGPSWTRDSGPYALEVRGGPALNYFRTIRGLGPDLSTWLEFQTRGEVKTHSFEYYARDPRQGWSAALETSSRVDGVASKVSADRLRLSGEGLVNLGAYEPPLAVLATRGALGTLWNGDRSTVFFDLPPPARFFLGGDEDFRGAQRKALPNDAGGFITAVYDGLELRAGDILPYGLQPLLFLDGAMGGRRNFQLDPDVYYAPGMGLRWASPFGSVRASVARGLVWGRGAPHDPQFTPRWQFFFSIGREF